MKIIKAINNNMVLTRDEYGKECICRGKGIGWKKRHGDTVDEKLIEQKFVPETADESTRFQKLFTEISEEFWEISERVLQYGKEKYNLNISQKVLLSLCDHMSGSIERIQKGISLDNPMLWEIKRVYPKEYRLGKYAVALLDEHFKVKLKEDEAAFLAFHFVNGQLKSMENVPPDELAKLAGEIIDIIQQTYQITLDEEEWNYRRFLTHLKFFVNRVMLKKVIEESGDIELYDEMVKMYPHANKCVEYISDFILINYHYDISRDEKLYLLIHIERVTRACVKNSKVK